MASSAQKPHRQYHRLPTLHGTTAAPPPTPSSQPNVSSNATTSDALFHLLHRLPPTLSLSLPTRRSSTTTTSITTPPLISLSDPTPSLPSALLSAATELGFFHLTPYPISSDLSVAAESATVSLFNLPLHQKRLLFPNNWPLGYDSLGNEDDEGGSAGEFCLDLSCPGAPASELGLNLGPLREFGLEMEKLGLEVMEKLASAVGFENPARDDRSKMCSMMWISDGENNPCRVYPYVVGLHYQARCQKYSLSSDSGWVTLSGRPDSVLVTLGDIAQVWSNGKLKKVRGRPMPSTDNDNNNDNDIDDSKCITISLLITLPLETTVTPLIPNLSLEDHEEGVDPTKNTREQRVFQSFSFEDYAWRIYHERLPLKDPLLRYRIQ